MTDSIIYLDFYIYWQKNEPDKADENYNQLWKMRAILDKLSDSYAKFYCPTEHLAVDEIFVLFKGRVYFNIYQRNTSSLGSKFTGCGILRDIITI
jgi:hypothetical protein